MSSGRSDDLAKYFDASYEQPDTRDSAPSTDGCNVGGTSQGARFEPHPTSASLWNIDLTLSEPTDTFFRFSHYLKICEAESIDMSWAANLYTFDMGRTI